MTLHTVLRFPSTPTMSPAAASSFARSSGPIRANARPTSLPAASVTLSLRVAFSVVVMTSWCALVGPRASNLHHAVVTGDLNLFPWNTFREQHFLAVFLVASLGREGQQIAIHFDVHVGGADAGHLRHHQHVTFFLEHVHRWFTHFLHHGAAGLAVLPEVAERLDARPFIPQADLDGEPVDSLHPLVVAADLSGLREIS